MKIALVVAFLTVPLLAAAVHAAPASATKAVKPGFAAAFEAFKKDMSDANREAVIAAARGKKPAEPEELEKFEGRAEFAIKNAKDGADFAAAAAEFRKAADAAPWKPDNYFNWGVAAEKGGKLADAKAAFEWYLKAAPSATDAKETRKRIAGLEMGIEQAASPKARAEKVLALYKEKFGGPVLTYAECGVNMNPHWYCTQAQDTPANFAVVPFESWRNPNPVQWTLADADKGVIKFDAHGMTDACGDAKGDTMDSVVWHRCDGRTMEPGDSMRFYNMDTDHPTFRWNFSCGSARYGADACRRMNLTF